MAWWKLIEYSCADANSNSPHYGDKMRYSHQPLHSEHFAELLSKDFFATTLLSPGSAVCGRSEGQQVKYIMSQIHICVNLIHPFNPNISNIKLGFCC